MNLLNATPMQAGYTLGLQPDGRERLVIVAKGTFTIPQSGKQASLHERQKSLIEADIFTGEPGLSAPLYEVDYAPFKPRCDVLLVGSAYAPKGKPTNRTAVTMRLGAVDKSFTVTGSRFWESGRIAISPGSPAFFDKVPITYDHAFGGIDNFHKNENKHSTFTPNPAGKGYHRQLDRDFVDGSPMPNTEDLKHPIRSPAGKYTPMALSPLGRGWEPRYRLAGTYDQQWVDNTFPFLPADFSEAYYQAAPADQQTPYPKGGEPVILKNLTADGGIQFTLPEMEVPVVFFYNKGESVKHNAVIDTIILEPDEALFTITWRTSLALKKSIFEIAQVLVGRKSAAWWRARNFGKRHYPSLAHVANKQHATLDY